MRGRSLFTDDDEWLDTPEGERARYWRRFADRVNVFADVEPRSKNSITRTEADDFVAGLRRSMGKRRGFRSPIAVELELHATADNPPEIHTVAKNYVDLLYRERAGAGRLCVDDRQIRYLAVSYTLKMVDTAAVIVRADRLSSFREDVRLARKIEAGRLGHSRKKDDDTRLIQDGEELREWERNRDHIVETYGTSFFDVHRRHLLASYQQGWLFATERLLHQCLLTLLGPPTPVSTEPLVLKGVELPAIDLDDLQKRFLFSDSVSLGLAPLPQKAGEGAEFKKAIEAALSNMRASMPRLFPLLTELAVVILLVPPRNGGNIDLDNLARKIVPRVHGVLEPPASKWFPNPDTIPEVGMRQFFEELERRRRRLPKHHITRYEVVVLPRTKGDPPAGTVRLVLCDGFEGQPFIQVVRDIIETWDDDESRR